MQKMHNLYTRWSKEELYLEAVKFEVLFCKKNTFFYPCKESVVFDTLREGS